MGASGEEFAKVRRNAEELYDAVVTRIQKREGCDASRAHYLAGQDEVGKRAYATVVEMQDRERTARDGANRMAAYLG